ncbi:hypothetical protein V7S43_015667 [Phytophthora oleae]|uniref:Crinkler effector protein N-terminal domain-containing protein n=1 Tax=Phytophthora oleae TaxID=2107226 RepID=A0ABD3F1A4_9STRA
MKKILGSEGSVISIVIDKWKTVALLKDAIQEKKKYQFPADDLKLFLAKNGNVWLSSSTEDVKKLKKGEIITLIEELTKEEQELQAESGLQNVLTGMEPPTTDQIHVLVVCPKERDTVSIPVVLSKGPYVDTTSCDDLLAFLEKDMVNKEKIVSRPHILYESRLQFRLVGREDAIKTAANCFSNIIEASGKPESDRTMQTIPVCSGISGLGKTRMLEEGGRILKEMRLDPKHIASVIVPYFNGFNAAPVERSMPTEASFSWRLLHRFFFSTIIARSLLTSGWAATTS